MSYGIKIKLPVSGQITEITGLFPPIYGAYSLTLEFDEYFQGRRLSSGFLKLRSIDFGDIA